MSTDAPNGNQYSDVEKPWHDEEVLRELYWVEGLGQRAIADRLNCGTGTVSRWMERHGIGTRSASGKDNPNWKGGQVTLTCDWCGDEYEVKPCRADEARFCSQRCRCEGVAEQHSGKDHSNWKGGQVTLTCDWCGDEYEVFRARADEARFCSQQCTGAWRSENLAGPNSPKWKDDYEANYGPGWRRLREEIVARDGSACRACGMMREEHLEKHGRGLDVHHVIPKRNFDSIEEANQPNNLVTACRPCHNKYEGLPVFPK